MSLAYIGAGTAIVGTGAQVAGMFGPQGGGGPSFGPGEAFAQLNATNPGFGDLRWIFGKGNEKKRNKQNNPFGNNLQNLVRDITANPQAMIPGTNTPLWSSILGNPDEFSQSMAGLRTGINNLSNAYQPAIDTAALYNATGNPTDGSAYFNEAIRRLQTEAIPNAAEVAGMGAQSSGFASASGQASQDLLGQASLANIDLAEAAANRRLQASPLFASLLTSQVSAPLNAQTQMAGLGTNLSNIFRSEQERPLNIFQSLYGMGANPGQFVQPSYNPNDTTSSYLSAANGISGILNGLSNFNLGSSTPSDGSGEEFLSSLYSLGGKGY